MSISTYYAEHSMQGYVLLSNKRILTHEALHDNLMRTAHFYRSVAEQAESTNTRGAHSEIEQKQQYQKH
jgi:hypothetical protein